MASSSIAIRVGHSPDPDDAFMFFALAKDRIDTGRYRFSHELVDIETLNRRALAGELELTAVSVHAYAYLTDRYILCRCGASMGDGYGPMLVARDAKSVVQLRHATIAVPGTFTTAFLALRLWLGADFSHVLVPFDKILDAVAAGKYDGHPIDAGLIIHEGQLTYSQQQLECLVDLGKWWLEETNLPLPLGANALRKDLGAEAIVDVHRLLLASIRYGLENRDEALSYALNYGRGLDRDLADRFVGMYVNEWTLDFGDRGRRAVQELLTRAFDAGVIPAAVTPEYVGG
ncbi:MAG: menaquinone biosynthesis family protein [Planctomycetota bacterium]